MNANVNVACPSSGNHSKAASAQTCHGHGYVYNNKEPRKIRALFFFIPMYSLVVKIASTWFISIKNNRGIIYAAQKIKTVGPQIQVQGFALIRQGRWEAFDSGIGTEHLRCG